MGLPACSFGPMLNFFGWWSPPGTKNRRLLAAEEAVAAAPAPALANGGSGGAPAAAPGEAAGGDKAQAQSEAWCTREGWWVEQVEGGRSGIWPPDLHAAQVAARKAGTLT